MTYTIKDTCQVKDLSDDHALIQVDWEIRECLEDMGLQFYIRDAQNLFVLTGGGDIQEVWVCESSVPYNEETIYRVY